MRIRWKLLILLLTIALTPLAVVSGLSVKSMRSLGQNLAVEVRQSLTDSAENQLGQLIQTYSKTVASEADSIELALRLQAREVENALRIESPPRRKVWSVEDFDNNDAGLGLTIDEHHMVIGPDGEQQSIPLSYAEQGFYVSPGASREALLPDMRRLSAMTPVYRSMQRAHRDMIHWQYTALESGLHSNFPGHGGIPDGYDPRDRPWYRNAKEANGLVWNPPIVDASTRQVMLTVSAPVRRPNGDLAGVTAIDVRMLDVVDIVELPEDWCEGSLVFLVVRSETPGSSREALLPDMRRLSAMTPVYRSMQRAHRDMIHWQYTALESGLHSNFPGHGGIPGGYDPRDRPWYRNAKEANDLVWNPPIVDASTRQVMLTVSAPVRRPNGDLAGVTAIDVRMLDVVDIVELPEDWCEGSLVFLVVRSETPGSDNDHLAILAQHEPDLSEARWDLEPEIEWLVSADEEPFLEMLEDMAAHRPGVKQMRFQDKNALWAYGAVDNEDSQLVVIVPRKLIVANAMVAEEWALNRTTRHLQYVGVVLLIALVLIAVIALVGSRTVTRPILSLVDAAHQIADGDLNVRVAIHSGDELEDLGNAFNSMAPKLRDRVRMLDSLSLAMEVQQSLLPSEPPEIPGFDIAGRSVYCDETGGDYYDFFDFREEGEGMLGLAVGDVSGHGIASALLMTTARALLHANASKPGSLAELMVVINDQLARDAAQGRFMTLSFMLLDTVNRSIRYVSAGHDPSLIYNPDEDRFNELRNDDIPLGIAEHWVFREYAHEALNPGEVLVIATDGVWDTRNEQDELFGKDRLREVIRNNAERSAHEIIDAVAATLDEFRQNEPSRDDVTLVVIKG